VRPGFHHRLLSSRARVGAKGVTFLAGLPSTRAIQHARDEVGDLTARRKVLHPVEWIVKDLNRFLRGSAAYFHCGNSADQFDKIYRHAPIRMATFRQAAPPLPQLRLVWCRLRLAEPTRVYPTSHRTVAAPRPFRAWLGHRMPAMNDLGEPCSRLHVSTDKQANFAGVICLPRRSPHTQKGAGRGGRSGEASSTRPALGATIRRSYWRSARGWGTRRQPRGGTISTS
jgi:RNA-directed DNA polymerase